MCDCLQSKDEKHFIHNHLTFTVKYHKDLQTDSARIVGFEVMPFRFVFKDTLYLHQHSLVEAQQFVYDFVCSFCLIYWCKRTDMADYISSVKHEYDGKWTENTRLTTCDPHAKRTVSNSNSPQEVETNQEIIFTYDVEFQVTYFLNLVRYGHSI